MKFAKLFTLKAPFFGPAALLFLGLSPAFSVAQNAFPQTEGKSMALAPARSVFDEMLAASSNKITITTDLDAIVLGRNELTYHPAQLVFDKKQTFNIELRPRGKFRRKICGVPPLKMKFSKKDLAAAGLSKLNDIKLVTHCADSDAGDQLLAREYIPYQMYAALTPISHRARLVDITYIDPKNEKNKVKRLGILLEDDDELAARLGGSIIDTLYSMPTDTLNAQLAAMNALFQYMIGNTDWSIEGVRNVKFLRPALGGKLCPVPYDFDFSGFVNASYASPNSEFPIKNVRERYWQGSSLPPEAVRRAAKAFHKNETRFHEIIDEAEGIDDEQKADLNAYIGSFFQVLKETGDLPVNKQHVAQR